VAALVVEGDQLVVRLSWWERLVAVHGDVRVPLATIRSASVVADPAEPRKRFHGADGGPDRWDVPYGVRTHYGIGKVFIATPRNRPAVHVTLEAPSKFAELLVSVADPEAMAASLPRATAQRSAPEGLIGAHQRTFGVLVRPR
jgi:hypothetical protein